MKIWEGWRGRSLDGPNRAKTARDEDFPVASLLLHPSRRAPVMAYYRFVRAADDIADDPALRADE